MRLRLTLALALVLTGAGAAFAHAELASSTPAEGETLAQAPSQVTLSFTERLEVRFSTFKVYPLEAEVDMTEPDAGARLSGLAGQLVSEVLGVQGDEEARADTGVSTTEATADKLTLPLKADLEAGTYVVMWRVLSVDTHELQGFLTFGIAP